MGLFLAILAIILSLIAGRWVFLPMALGVIAAGFGVAVYRDRVGRCSYVLASDQLVLRKAAEERVVPLDQIRDASLLGLAAARAYFFQRLGESDGDELQYRDRDRRSADFLRFSPVDLGLSPLSFGLGTRMMERLAHTRHDMVLLRLADGTDHLLGPVHAEDLVTAIERARSKTQQ
jgi:hypothetical protein